MDTNIKIGKTEFNAKLNKLTAPEKYGFCGISFKNTVFTSFLSASSTIEFTIDGFTVVNE